VVPATTADVRLWAELETATGLKVNRRSVRHQPDRAVGCTRAAASLPRAMKLSPNAEADCAGSGSLYTSPCCPCVGAGNWSRRSDAAGLPRLTHLQPDDPARGNRFAC